MNKNLRLTCVALGIAFLSQASSATEFITNGDFEQLTGVHSPVGGVVYPGFYSLNTSDGPSPITDWSFAGVRAAYFVSAPGYADDPNNFVAGNVFGPHNGSNNGLTATSPTGGNFVVLDGDHLSTDPVPLLSQTVNGLTVGQAYDLSFWFATAEGTSIQGSPKTTHESLQVSFGDSTVSTETRTTAPRGFTAWAQENFVFTATATSQVLSFLAQGAPAGSPPQSLLDGISLKDVPAVPAVPEPSAWAMVAAGMAAVAFVTRRSRRRQA